VIEISFYGWNGEIKLLFKCGFYITSSFFVGVIMAAALQRFNNIFFYNIFYGTLTSVLVSLFLLLKFKKKFFIEKNQWVFIVIISGLLTFSFLSTVPLTVDRSYSVWLLKHASELSVDNKQIPLTALTEDSIKFFAPENGQLDRRIQEQVRLGNLEKVEPGAVQITKKGKLIAKLNSFIGWIFSLQPKYSRL
jgi:hypothetical protein